MGELYQQMNKDSLDYLENTFSRNFRGFDPLVEFPLSDTISHIISCTYPDNPSISSEDSRLEKESRDCYLKAKSNLNPLNSNLSI